MLLMKHKLSLGNLSFYCTEFLHIWKKHNDSNVGHHSDIPGCSLDSIIIIGYNLYNPSAETFHWNILVLMKKI